MWGDRHRDILFEALERTESERGAYLDAACGDDADLRRQLDDMIAAHAEATQFLADRTVPAAETPGGAAVGEGPGSALGPYRLLEQIGEGGFGKVFLAEQSNPIVRRVAVKVVKPGMDSEQVIARFGAERQALAMMDHPGIATVYDAGATPAGRPYFVMEYVEGLPLTDYCDRHNLAIHQRLALFEMVCHAVHHAHQKGIVHRDLKPSNVLVTHVDGEPRPKVIDFGIAKAMHLRLTDATVHTGPHQVLGTPQYMSPEQIEQQSEDIDTRTDIYSLGVMLYEMLVGASPFDPERFRRGSYEEIMRLVRDEEPPRPSTRASGLGDRLVEVARARRIEPAGLRRLLRGDLDWIVLKAMDKDRARRYAAASGLAHDVRRFLRDEPVEARPPGALYVARKFVWRHRAAVAAAAMVVAALVAGLALALAGLGEARQKLWESYLNEARAARSGRAAGRRFRALDVLADAARIAPTLEVRNEAIEAMALADVRLERRWLDRPGASAMGLRRIDRFAHVTAAGDVRVVATADDRVLAELPSAGLPPLPWVFSPGGDYVAVPYRAGAKERVVVWDVAAARPVCESAAPGVTLAAVLFDPRGAMPRWVAMAENDGGLLVHALPGGESIASPSLADVPLRPAIDRRGERLASIDHDASRVVVWDIADIAAPAELFDVELDSAPFAHAFGPDGGLAVGVADGDVVLLDGETGRVTRRLSGHQAPTVRVEFAFDDRLLVTHGWDSTVRVWDVEAGRELLDPLAHWAIVGAGDRLLLARGGEVSEWSFTRGDEYARVAGSGSFGRWPFVSLGPRGRWAVTGGECGVDLWDVGSGERIAKLSALGSRGAHLLPDLGAVIAAVADAADPPTTERFAAKDFLRWPLRRDGESWVIGEPELLWQHPGTMWMTVTRDGRIVAGREEAGWDLTIFDPRSGIATPAGGYDGVAAPPSVSPDGRWLFSGNWRGQPGRVRDLVSGDETPLLPPVVHMTGEFSPDGRWLAVATGVEVRFYEVGRWERPAWTRVRGNREETTGAISFTDGGRLLAITESRYIVDLLDVDARSLVARITAPDFLAFTHIATSADGSVLAGLTRGRFVKFWRLDRIRARLGAMGLDWRLAGARLGR